MAEHKVNNEVDTLGLSVEDAGFDFHQLSKLCKFPDEKTLWSLNRGVRVLKGTCCIYAPGTFFARRAKTIKNDRDMWQKTWQVAQTKQPQASEQASKQTPSALLR